MGMDFDTANDVVRRLRRLAIAQRGRKSELLHALGLKPGQDVILLELSRLGQSGQLELANASEVDEPSVCRSLARLERQGLVERVVDPNDARRRVVALSPEGRILVPKLKRIYMRVAQASVGEPGSATHKKALKALDEITERLS